MWDIWGPAGDTVKVVEHMGTCWGHAWDGLGK